MATLPISPGDDLEGCADLVRPYAALYVGGMGSKEQNFYNALAIRMGYEQAAEEVQTKYLARDYEGAMSALPLEFLDRTSLLGSTERIAERMREYASAGVTTLALALPDSVPLPLRLGALRIGAAAYEKSGATTSAILTLANSC